MPEVTPDTSQDVNSSPLPNPTESPKDVSQSRKTLVIGAGLVVTMLILVGITFYSLRAGSTSSSPASSPSPAPVAAQSSVGDQTLDNSISQVNSDFSSIDNEVNGANDGLNDKSIDLTY